MSKVSGTDSLAFLQNLGLNTTTGKTTEDGAGLFAAMLQGMPADGETAVAADDAALTALLPATDATTTPEPTSTGAGVEQLLDDAVLPQAAIATVDAGETDVETAEATTTAGSQEAVQFFEDQLALQRRFNAPAKTAPEKSAAAEDMPAPATIAGSAEPAVKDTTAAKGRKPLPAEASTAATGEVQTSANEKNSPADAVTPHARLSDSDADAGSSAKPAAPMAAAAIAEDATVYLTTADNSASARGKTAAPALVQGFTPLATAGKGLPQGGKSLPTAKAEVGKAQASDKAQVILAGFTEVSSLEDTGLSFDDIASTLLAHNGSENTQATPSSPNAAAFAIDNGGRESLAESTAPELLPDSATTLEANSTMGTDGWVEDTATQLSWLQEQGIEKAHIRLHPEDLGSLDVSITVNEGQAYVQIVTSTPEARELLQNSLPSLREMLQHSGLALAEGHVSQGDTHKGQDNERSAQQQNRFTHTPEAQPQNHGWMRPAAQSRSSIDYYI